MKQILFLVAGCAAMQFSFGQKSAPVIDEKNVTSVEQTLSSDAMLGRKVFTASIDSAADFIASQFKSAGLQTFNGSDTYLQTFNIIHPDDVKVSGAIDSRPVSGENVIPFTSKSSLTVTEQSGYETATIAKGESLIKAMNYIGGPKNYLVLVDESFASKFPFLLRLRDALFPSENSTVFILTSDQPKSFSIQVQQQSTEKRLANVVGVLPGKTKKNEFVIFSGHYDHLGIDKPSNGDSVYNGANDDASGVTAVINLAKYYAAKHNNERSLIFAAFTAEEIGGYGSQYFSKQLDADKIVAMLNIEMIGTESKWGKNSAYITGYEKSSLGTLLQENLKGSSFSFHPDPYPKEQLFYRSDNATLARLGVPAHTISTSKMDDEPNYHKPSDEIGTLDMSNMTAIIRAIALSATSLVDGTKTPTRVTDR